MHLSFRVPYHYVLLATDGKCDKLSRCHNHFVYVSSFGCWLLLNGLTLNRRDVRKPFPLKHSIAAGAVKVLSDFSYKKSRLWRFRHLINFKAGSFADTWEKHECDMVGRLDRDDSCQHSCAFLCLVHQLGYDLPEMDSFSLASLRWPRMGTVSFFL